MNDDQVFRLMLAAGFLTLLPFGVYHRLKSRTGEKLDRRQEGLLILISLRLVGLLGWFGLLAYLLNPAWMVWAALSLPVWLRWIGVGFLAGAGALLIWTLRSLGRNLTDTVVTRQNHTLIITGPYRWIRHPLYTSAALMIPASTLITANWFFLATGLVVVLLLAIRTRKEEANLIARFGDEYRKYLRRTGRFLPRLGRASH